MICLFKKGCGEASGRVEIYEKDLGTLKFLNLDGDYKISHGWGYVPVVLKELSKVQVQ